MDALQEESSEKRSNRGRFLRQAGLTLAAAIGIGALAGPAFAATGQCCENCSRCGGCGTETCYCYCDCSGTGGTSYCWTASSGCLKSGCVSCPC